MKLLHRISCQVLIAFLLGTLALLFSSTPSTHADGINHTITYDRNGGTGKIPKQNPVSEATFFTVAASTYVFKFGFTFIGWSDGITRYVAGASYTVGKSDITLTAQWTVNTKRVITCSMAGGSGIPPTPIAVQQGVSFTIPRSNGLTKAGFTFDGWSDGVNTYQPGASYTIGGSKILFTAQWIPSS